jgi:uncharacterized protein (DUF433 family)
MKAAEGREPMFDNRITQDPNKMGGKPCIRGMRVRVKDILDMLADGASRSEILADFPYLEEDDISAATNAPSGPAQRT